MKKSIKFLFAALGGFCGYQLSSVFNHSLFAYVGIHQVKGEAYWLIGMGAILFFLAAAWISEFIVKTIVRGEENLQKIPAPYLFAGIVGLIVGLLVSVMLFPSIAKLSGEGAVAPVLVTVVLGYVGFRMGYKKKDDIISLLAAARGNKDRKNVKRYEEHKILDTSVIIDGRIADICKTGFIEGTLVIPGFVLEELQHIADSSDLLKRNRGRRGLDILNKIQKELDVKVLIYEGDFEEITEVDSKLIRLAKVLEGKVVTNDFNLNKVCELQGVSVLNINDLANAVKPVVLPGEEIYVQVIKDGKEHGQGVAYLDDGTMIVVECGREFIGSNLEVLVTSVLQTSAGRMIFAKPKLLEKAQ